MSIRLLSKNGNLEYNFGIEYEIAAPWDCPEEAKHEFTLTFGQERAAAWIAKYDRSIICPSHQPLQLELISPVLTYNTENIQHVLDVAQWLKNAGCITNESTGLHAHFSVSTNGSTIKDPFVLAAIAFNAAKHEHRFYKIFPNRKHSEYCQPIKKTLYNSNIAMQLEGIKNIIHYENCKQGSINSHMIKEIMSVLLKTIYSNEESMCDKTSLSYRRRGTNIINLADNIITKKEDKPTIEFRYGAGTLKPQKIKEYLALCYKVFNEPVETQTLNYKNKLKIKRTYDFGLMGICRGSKYHRNAFVSPTNKNISDWYEISTSEGFYDKIRIIGYYGD